MGLRKEVVLWSSNGSGDGSRSGPTATAPASVAGGFTDCVETHGGENNGSAQGRLCARNGKYASLDGLSWMKDVKTFSSFWSQSATDPNQNPNGSSGSVVNFDYVAGGPYTRLEHVHILDCAGFDYCQIFWQAKCLAHEGLAINNAVVADPTNQVIADFTRVGAAGMPAIDSSEPMFSIPKLMRLNENTSLANEGQITANPSDTTTDKSPGSGNARPVPLMWGATATGANWEPDQWIQSGAPLWVQWRGAYPGTDKWSWYDMLRPAIGFETNSAFEDLQNANGPPGMLQWGKVFKSGATTRYKFYAVGDKFETSFWLGYPVRALVITSALSGGLQATGPTTAAQTNAPLLRITGLARIALTIGANRLSWHGEGLNGLILNQDRTAGASSYLASTPVGGLPAPRQHIRGRLVAVLTSDTGRTF